VAGSRSVVRGPREEGRGMKGGGGGDGVEGMFLGRRQMPAFSLMCMHGLP